MNDFLRVMYLDRTSGRVLETMFFSCFDTAMEFTQEVIQCPDIGIVVDFDWVHLEVIPFEC